MTIQSTSDHQDEKPGRLDWRGQNSYHRIEFFLYNCRNQQIKDDDLSVPPYIDLYRKHGITHIAEGYICLNETEQVAKFLTDCDSKNDDQVKRYLVTLLNSNRHGSGRWIDLIDVDQITHYEFNAKSRHELSFQYAQFLVDLGVIEPEKNWVLDPNLHLYKCPITTIGADVLLEIASKHEAVKVVFEEGADPNANIKIALGRSSIIGDQQITVKE